MNAARRISSRASGTPASPRRWVAMLSWLAPLTLAVACSGHQPPSGTSRAALVDDNSPLPVPSDTIVSPDLSASNKVVDSLSGTSSVSPDGQAHYAIPLWVSPGRAGMQPELALEYSSRSSNGILGVGWSLTGFSQITRCPRGYATDGVVAPITFDDHDVFCLDGQHLKQLGTSTTYPRYYHTERDIFTRVVAQTGTSGPSTFTAYEKNGRIDEYTGYSLGRMLGSQPINSIWLLTKTSDRYGNTITYAYDQFKSNNFAQLGDYYYPSTITYTGSSTTAGNRSVRFFYTDRNDPQTSYSVGFVCIKHLLDHIEVWGPGDQKPLRTYTFSYNKSPQPLVRRYTWRSRLYSIVASDANGKALASTDFEWESGQPGFMQLDTSVTDYAASESLKGFQIVDVNQDGFGDLLYVTKDSNGHPEYGVRLWQPGHFDFGPLYELHVKPSKDKWGTYTFPRAALALGNSIGLLMTGNPTGTNWPDPTPFFLMVQTLADGTITGNTVYPFDANADMVVPGDFDGDGLADIILGYTKNGNGVFNFLRNTQQSTLSFAAPVTLSSPAYPVLPTKGTGMPMRTVDFDGDGRQELVVCFKTPYPQYTPYDITTTGYTAYPVEFSVPQENRGLIPCDSRDNAIYADLNGDGLDDTLYTRQGSGAWAEIFFNSSPTSIRDGLQGIHGDANITYDEQTQDGKTALIDYEGIGTWQLLSTGPKTPDSIVPATWPYDVADSSLDFNTTSDNVLAVGDLNGDGLDDIVQWENGRFEVYQSKGNRPDMLTRVVDGVGAETRFIYAPVTDPIVYTNDYVNYAYPLRRLNGGLWVVSQHQVSNGVKADPTQYFHKYTNGVLDIQGRGFLGFNRHEVDYYENGNLRSRMEAYDNTTRWFFTEPYAGLPRVVDACAYDGKGHVVHEEVTSTTWNIRWHDDTNIYFPYPRQRESQIFDLDASGALVKTADRISYIDAIDDYGNVLTSRTDNGARDLRQQDITYRYTSSAWSNDMTWLINAPVKVVTQSHLALPPPAHGPTITSTTAYDYDAKGALTWKIDEPDFDANGNVVTLAQPQPDGMQTSFTHYTRDPDGQVGSVTRDSSNAQTSLARTYTFYRDDADRVAVTRIRNPLGRISHIATHPGFGVIAATQDQNGLYSRYQYDTFGRLKRSERNGTEPYSVNYYGYAGGTGVDSSKPPLEVVMTGDSGETTTTYFDILGRPTKRSALARNDGAVVYDEIQYDERGRVAATSRPHFDQATTWFDQFTYDDAGRPLRRQFADGRVSQWTYRALANTGLTIDHFDAETTDPHVLRTTKTYDYAGRLISSVEHAAAHNGRPARDLSVNYSYGNFDTLVDVDSNGVGSTSFAYDRSQRRVYAQDSGLGQRWFSYDPFDEIVTEVVGDANGNQGEVRKQEYDGLGRP
jgi:YD repeat-containing protein